MRVTDDALDRALAPGGVRAVFQPLVDLETRAVLGYEALARGPEGPLTMPERLFAAARAAGRLAELDWACRAAALSGALEGGLGHGCTLFVNVEPGVPFAEVPPAHRDLVAEAERSLRVVLEVTEQSIVERPSLLLTTLDWARDRAWGVALDDIGENPGSLALMPFLEPDVVKLDLRLVQARPDSEVGEIVSAVLSQAERTGARVVAEGIETEDHLRAALALGATIGQGWLLGRPGPLDEVARPGATIELLEGPMPRLAQTPFSVVRGARPMRRGPKALLEGIAGHLEEQAAGWRDGPVILSTFQSDDVLPAKVLRRYAALAGDGAYVAVLGPDVDADPAPGVRGVRIEPGSPLAEEWSTVLVGPHYAGALVARDVPAPPGEDGRWYDFAVTHDRALVVAAGRALLRHVEPSIGGSDRSSA